MQLRKRKLAEDLAKDEAGPKIKKTEPKKKEKKEVEKNEGKQEDKPSTSSAVFRIEDYLTENEWKRVLEDEFKSDYFAELNMSLGREFNTQHICPPKELVFRAFNLTKLSDIRCVILGQDPYHDENQAQGLAFSVPSNIDTPRSLQNIYKELKTDLGDEFVHDESLGGNLESWTKQGVFLLNVILTVRLHLPGSHSKLGWQKFTDKVISLISEKNTGCVFLLWGKFAETKESLIDTSKHKVIKSAHPSPMSVQKFYNCKCFSQTNQYLRSIGKDTIDWSLKKDVNV